MSAEAPLIPFAPGALVHLGGTLVEVCRIEGGRTTWPALPEP